MRGVVKMAAATGLVAAAISMGGCLINSRSHDTTSGAYVGHTTFNQIEPGVTTERWVRDVLGKPTSCTEMEDGSELMKWSYTKKHSSSGSVFLVFGGSSNREEVGTTYVQVKDGIVTKAWRD